MTSALSVFDKLEPFKASPPRVDLFTGRLRKRGDTLFHSTFENGSFEGWRDHFAYATPRGAIGLTQYPVYSGTHALMLSTGETTYGTGTQANGTGTYKNLSRYGDWDLVSFSGMFALAGDGSLTEWKFPFQSFELGLDNQSPDSSTRSFFKAQLKDSGNGVFAWYIRKHEGGTSTFVKVPGTDRWHSGMNERKWNFMYVRLTVSLKANGGLGGYVELQVNNKTFDLTGLGAGNAGDLLLANGSWDHFAAGFNPAITLTRSSANPDYKYNVVVCDELWCTVNDKGA